MVVLFLILFFFFYFSFVSFSSVFVFCIDGFLFSEKFVCFVFFLIVNLLLRLPLCLLGLLGLWRTTQLPSQLSLLLGLGVGSIRIPKDKKWQKRSKMYSPSKEIRRNSFSWTTIVPCVSLIASRGEFAGWTRGRFVSWKRGCDTGIACSDQRWSLSLGDDERLIKSLGNQFRMIRRCNLQSTRGWTCPRDLHKGTPTNRRTK